MEVRGRETEKAQRIQGGNNLGRRSGVKQAAPIEGGGEDCEREGKTGSHQPSRMEKKTHSLGVIAG